jgi:hypothetical protein
MALKLSALRSSLPLPPWRFLVLISIRGWVDPRNIAAERIRSIEKYNDLIGYRTGDLLACSIVIQTTTLQRYSIQSRNSSNSTYRSYRQRNLVLKMRRKYLSANLGNPDMRNAYGYVAMFVAISHQLHVSCNQNRSSDNTTRAHQSNSEEIYILSTRLPVTGTQPTLQPLQIGRASCRERVSSWV